MGDVNAFIEITGVDKTVAENYMEMAGYDFHQALDIYYSNSGEPQANRPRPDPVNKPSPPINPRPSPKPQADMVDDIFNRINDQGEEKAPPENLEKRKITFWKSGFQVDDGEYRTYDDPANADFLQACSRGQVPRELIRPGVSDVDVDVDNQREKEYAPTKPKFVPFSGQAHSLNDPSSRPPPQPVLPSKPQAAAKTDFAVEGAPSTKIRIQTPDRKTTMIIVPLNATILELKRFIVEAKPELSQKRLVLQSTFPTKALGDDSATIEQENLKMATISVSF